MDANVIQRACVRRGDAPKRCSRIVPLVQKPADNPNGHLFFGRHLRARGLLHRLVHAHHATFVGANGCRAVAAINGRCKARWADTNRDRKSQIDRQTKHRERKRKRLLLVKVATTDSAAQSEEQDEAGGGVVRAQQLDHICAHRSVLPLLQSTVKHTYTHPQRRAAHGWMQQGKRKHVEHGRECVCVCVCVLAGVDTTCITQRTYE